VKLPSACGPGKSAVGPDYLVGRPLDEVERYYMEKALELTGGNREEAAQMLNISERTMYRKLQEWKKEHDKTDE
jgi:two-component system response regulator HydG